MAYTEVTSVEIAFKQEGYDLSKLEENFAWIKDEQKRAFKIVQFKLEVVTAAINMGWQANWFNIEQKKWYNWWKFEGSENGFSGRGLSLYDVSYGYSYSHVTPCLCFESEEKSCFAALNFKNLYQEYYEKGGELPMVKTEQPDCDGKEIIIEGKTYKLTLVK